MGHRQFHSGVNGLKRLCSEQPRQRHHYINPLLFAYCEVPQESAGFSPFELLYGRAVGGPMFILKELWTKELDFLLFLVNLKCSGRKTSQN